MASWRDNDELDYAEQHESGQLRLGVAGEQRALLPLEDHAIPLSSYPHRVVDTNGLTVGVFGSRAQAEAYAMSHPAFVVASDDV